MAISQFFCRVSHSFQHWQIFGKICCYPFHVYNIMTYECLGRCCRSCCSCLFGNATAQKWYLTIKRCDFGKRANICFLLHIALCVNMLKITPEKRTYEREEKSNSFKMLWIEIWMMVFSSSPLNDECVYVCECERKTTRYMQPINWVWHFFG